MAEIVFGHLARRMDVSHEELVLSFKVRKRDRR
jgi:hypothetical protein